MPSEPVDVRPECAAPADGAPGRDPQATIDADSAAGGQTDLAVDVAADEDVESGVASEANRRRMDSPVADRVSALLSPVVASVGVELLDVEWTGSTLRVVLDHEDGVTTDSLTKVNRLISPILDQHDPVPGRYTLEVSSPGVERPLRRQEHYRRAVGESIVVKAIPGIDPRRVKGLLRAVDATELTIEVVEIDGVDLAGSETMRIDLADVASARTVFDWGPGPKPGQAKAGHKGAGANVHPKNQKHSQRKSKKKASAKKRPGGTVSVETPGDTASVETPDRTASVETPDRTASAETPDRTASAETVAGAEKSTTSQPKTPEQERGRP
ncbi:MAG: ribosome maturation factor RimP [Acidimicrobiales bacterium]